MEKKINDLLDSRFTYISLDGSRYLRKYDRCDVLITYAVRELFRYHGYNSRNFSVDLTMVYDGPYSGVYALSIAFVDEDGYLHHFNYIMED